MTLKSVTCNSFPWNKAGDFRTAILCPNMDKNEIEAAREKKKNQLWTRVKRFKVMSFLHLFWYLVSVYEERRQIH